MQLSEIIEDITFEIERIDELFRQYIPLLLKIRDQEPDLVELGSLAMLLHSFYNGLESVFTRIAREIDDDVPSGKGWPSELLDQMAGKTMGRDFPVLSEETRDVLKKYLRFKQSSRFADTFHIDWGAIKDLVFEIDETKNRVLKEIRSFLGDYQSRF